MLKRLLPLVIALAVAGAPVALEACQVVCSSSMAHPAMAHTAMDHAGHDDGHACHDAAVGTGPQLSQGPHTCDHSRDGQPPAPNVVAPQPTAIAVALALVAASSGAIEAPAPTPSLWTITALHPVRQTGLTSAIPLRI
jgi:hypothetical protein